MAGLENNVFDAVYMVIMNTKHQLDIPLQDCKMMQKDSKNCRRLENHERLQAFVADFARTVLWNVSGI